MTKSIWTSKTFWLNVLAVVIMVLEMLVDFQPIGLEWQVLIAAVLNILVRIKTNQPVELPGAIMSVVDAVKGLKK